jgi:probable HAF family extracellular repeat protein
MDMKKQRLKNSIGLFAVLCGAYGAAAAGEFEGKRGLAPPEYKLVDLGTFRAQGINRKEDVVGGSYLYVHESRTLATLGDQAMTYGINDHGVIVGESEMVNGPFEAAIWHKSGGYEQIQPPSVLASVGLGISDTGWVAVTAYGPHSTWGYAQNLRHPAKSSEVPNVALQNGAFVGGCLCFTTEALAVNDSGTVTGDTQFTDTKWVPPADPPLPYSHAYLWKNNSLTDLGVLPGLGTTSFSTGYGINNHDDVVGSSTGSTLIPTPTGPSYIIKTHAFIYHAGKMRDLGVLGHDPQSQANGINDNGEIVGLSGRLGDLEHPSRAFVYVDGHMYDLNALVEGLGHTGVELNEAVAINCHGDIAANHRNSDYTSHAYLLVRKGNDRGECRKHDADER